MHALTLAESRLAHLLGPEKARDLISGALKSLHISDATTPTDLLLVAQHLISHGGFIEIVGRTLKTHAILAGGDVRSFERNKRAT